MLCMRDERFPRKTGCKLSAASCIGKQRGASQQQHEECDDTLTTSTQSTNSTPHILNRKVRIWLATRFPFVYTTKFVPNLPPSSSLCIYFTFRCPSIKIPILHDGSLQLTVKTRPTSSPVSIWAPRTPAVHRILLAATTHRTESSSALHWPAPQAKPRAQSTSLYGRQVSLVGTDGSRSTDRWRAFESCEW